MFIARGLMRYSYLIVIIMLILICPFAFPKAAVNSATIFSGQSTSASLGFPTIALNSSNTNEVTIYQIPISEKTQRDIWKLCEENHLSYELVLAVLQTEGNNNISIFNIKTEIEILAYYRDYWTCQGFPDEKVFDLLLLSKQRGIEACLTLMNNNYPYDLDNYVRKVTRYKSDLEQSVDAQLPVNLGPSSDSII